MDPEKTMEFILEQQAAMSVRQDAIFNMIEAGMKLLAGHDRRIAGHDRRIAGHDRQINALADGLERVVEAQGRLTHAQQMTEERLSRLAEAQQATEVAVEKVAAAQAVTDEKLNRLIDTLQRNASNGRPTA